MERLIGIVKARYTLIILSLCLIVMLNSCGTIVRNVGYGLSESEIEEQNRDAESMYNAILEGKLEGSKKNWNTVIKRLNDIVEHHPKSRVADDALYNLGLCYIWSSGQQKDLIKKSIKAFGRLTYYYPKSEFMDEAYYWRAYAYLISGDKKRAILEFERFRMKFPQSPLYDDAGYQINECRAKTSGNKEIFIPKDTYISEQKQKTEKQEKPEKIKEEQVTKKEEPKKPTVAVKPSETRPSINPELSPSEIRSQQKREYIEDRRLSVKEIRFHSSQEYTRVVIDLNQSAKYDTMKLSNPDRLCINIRNSMLSPPKQNFDIEDNLIKSIRAAQFEKDTVRVVLDLKTIKNHKIFMLKNPFRIVVDVFGDNSRPSPRPPESDPKVTRSNKETPSPVTIKDKSPTLVKQLGLKVRTIVIDPGHGGKDPGAISRSGLYEKHFVLDIAKRLKNKLKAEGFYEVYMTRETDVFVPLKERTAFANRVGADVFISIHINASESSSARGIETYYLSLASDEEARLTAALENASSDMGIRDLSSLLGKMLRGVKVDESRSLAGIMQTHICRINNSCDRGIKRAPFIVLIGANAPSILVELGFMSNSQDEKLLITEKYKDDLANALMNGIENYVKTIDPSG